ncbi:MAG: hypothetical protein ACUVXI_19090 [bacterium]
MAALLAYKAGEGAVEKALSLAPPESPFKNFSEAIEYIRTNKMYLSKNADGTVAWKPTKDMKEEEKKKLLGSFETNPLLYIDFTLAGESLLDSLLTI